MKKGFIFLVFCLICGEVFAGVFTVVPTDKSQEYLGIIFGGSIGPISLGGGNNPMLSLMFQRFNFIIVTIGAVVLSYIGVLVTINTAREGEAMGKKISLWVPLRAFAGMLLMVPGPTSGYSVVQMTVIWVVLNGIGAANSVWNVVLGQLSQKVAAVGALQIQMQPSNLNTLTYAVLQASTCMYSINSYMTELNTNAGPMQNQSISSYTVTNPASPASSATPPTSITQTATVFIGVQNAAYPLNSLCGSFTVSSTLDQSSTLNTFNYATVQQRLLIKVAGLTSMFSAVAPAAQLLANNAGNYSQPDPGYVRASGQAYISQIAQLATGIQAQAGSNAQSWEAGQNPINSLSVDFAQLQSYGWIHAGSYYFTMVGATTAQLDSETVFGRAILPTPNGVPDQTNLNANGALAAPPWQTVNRAGTSQLTDILSSGAPNFQVKKMNNALTHSYNYWSTDQNTMPPPSEGLAMPAASTGNSTMDAILNGIRTGIQAPILRYIQSIASGSANASFSGSAVDPLISIGQFGGTLMIAGEIAAFVSFITSFFISAAVSAGACVSPWAYAFNLLFVSLLPLVYSLAILMWTLGATLGIYLPLVPYLVFTMSAFGWMIAVIEAVVAAPMIALGLVQPGEGELGKITKALGILANIFLRPTLMIFGFVLGASLLRAGIALINFGFIPAIQQGAAVSIFSIIAILGMYVGIITAIINKSFSLIYLLPTQIMRWMGGDTEAGHGGEEAMVGKAEKGFEGGAAQAQKGLDTAHAKGTERIGKAQDKSDANEAKKGSEEESKSDQGNAGNAA